MDVTGNIVDLIKKEIFPGKVTIEKGKIASIQRMEKSKFNQYILPGFIDAHIHIESSMMIPSEFARLAVVHGTVATVSDPHEIGNVLGLEGVRYMLNNGKKVPFNFYFGASPCVPATSFETAGAKITPEQIRTLFSVDQLHYLSEMMNFPGVLANDPEVMEKIKIAKEFGKPVDGHAPGLRGKEAERYIAAGISTDHECFTLEEALDKLRFGMKIIIREGSAAKNFEALHSLIKTHPDLVMFCSDDKHPHELVKGHINLLVRRAIVEKGYPVIDVLRCACVHPVKHYKLDVGLLQPGDPADFIIVDDLHRLNVLQTYIKGTLVADKDKSLISPVKAAVINNFNAYQTTPDEFASPAKGKQIRVIEALDGELITNSLQQPSKIKNGMLIPDIENDILKIAVVNRYQKAPPAIAFIRGFGLKKGAIASSVAHDSHNIIAVGTTDEEICLAVNTLMKHQGGVAAVSGKQVDALPLPIAGLMSHEDGYVTAKKYALIDQKAKDLGGHLQAPFMTLSFMALLVIPSLKLSDKGLFDGKTFRFTDVNIK